eukprot:8032477-Lingulodinium_polyedra.AAC.1
MGERRSMIATGNRKFEARQGQMWGFGLQMRGRSKIPTLNGQRVAHQAQCLQFPCRPPKT